VQSEPDYSRPASVKSEVMIGCDREDFRATPHRSHSAEAAEAAPKKKSL